MLQVAAAATRVTHKMMEAGALLQVLLLYLLVNTASQSCLLLSMSDDECGVRM